MNDLSSKQPSNEDRITGRESELKPSESELFQRFKSYPFNTDLEFANGLSIILGHPNTPATETEINREDDLVLQAKCFYFSRKQKLTSSLNFAAYKTWLVNSEAEPLPSTQSDQNSLQPANTSGQATGEPSIRPSDVEENNPQSHASEPAYPNSFARIVELITTGQPIPGIQQIPDTILTGHDTSSEKPRRRKPWEREGDETDEQRDEK